MSTCVIWQGLPSLYEPIYDLQAVEWCNSRQHTPKLLARIHSGSNIHHAAVSVVEMLRKAADVRHTSSPHLAAIIKVQIG